MWKKIKTENKSVINVLNLFLGSIFVFKKRHKYQKEDMYGLFLLCYPFSIYKEKRREKMKKIQGRRKNKGKAIVSM